MANFKVKYGELPQWVVVYQRLSSMQIGDVLRDEELYGLIPQAPQASMRVAFFRAVKQMELDNHRTFDRVRTVGYRMVEAVEHEDLARRQHRKANRRMKAAMGKLTSADRTRMTPDVRRRFDAMEDHVARQLDMIKRLDTRLGKVEERTATTEKDQVALADRVDKLEDLLKRFGVDR